MYCKGYVFTVYLTHYRTGTMDSPLKSVQYIYIYITF
jgi:hypothetical protein